MRNPFACLLSAFLIFLFTGQLSAQQSRVTPTASSTAASPVPRLIKFSGTLQDAQGQALKSPAGVTFALYAQQAGDAALWMETQNVELEAKGNYTVLLGSNSANGVPAELFSTGEARWLGIQVERQVEEPRILLVSVPYALKASDADTLGGKPASSFVAAGGAESATVEARRQGVGQGLNFATPPLLPSAGLTTSVAGGGTANTLAMWIDSATLGDSAITQNAGRIGIGLGTTPPGVKLDVNGSTFVRGVLRLPATGTATSTAGFNSNMLDFVASTFKSGGVAMNPIFRWQAEPAGNNTANPSGTLNLLFTSGTGAPAETGLSISNKGILSFAPGQPMPTVTGNETVTGNVSANQLQSNVATGTAPFVVKSTTQVANLNASFLGGMPASSFATHGFNSFSGTQIITGSGNGVLFLGDPGCGSQYAGIAFAAFSGCTNYSLAGDGVNTFVGRPPGGTLSFVGLTDRGGGAIDMQINPGGLVGIGTATPTGQLSVVAHTNDGSPAFYGQGQDSLGTRINGGYGVISVGGLTQASSGTGGEGVRATGGSATASGGAGGIGLTAIGGSAVRGGGGFGGFGISAFGGVNGDGSQARAGEFQGDVEVTGCLSVSPGNPSTHFQVGSCMSDVRLKKNIEPFPAVLDKLVQLQPVSYNWKTDEYPQFRFSAGKTLGLIAQEVEKVLPDMVSTDQAGYKRVNYGELPYLMLQAIRELKAENDNLQEELKTKEAQWEERFRAQEQRAILQQVQQRVAALEARLAIVESRGGSNEVSARTREAQKEMTSAAE